MPSRYALRATSDRSSVVDELARHLPRVGLDGVLADLDRTGTPFAVPGEAAGDGFCWELRDRDDPVWWPQGVASARSGDVLFVSWYAKRRRLVTQGARITVVDRTDPAVPRYRHVLLVTPRRRPGRPSLGPVAVHAGGIAVRDDLLYVADTFFGVRVFRLSDVLRVPRSRGGALLPWAQPGTRAAGRQGAGGRTAHGNEYVLPQSLRLRVPLRAGVAAMRHSFLFVGPVRGRLSLVVGEYVGEAGRGAGPRLARYPLQDATGLLAPGDVLPSEVHVGQPRHMQGVAVAEGTWYVSTSVGPDRPGDLYVGAPGDFRCHAGVLPVGTEDLDWSRPGQELWSASEYPGRRWVFPIDVGRWPGPPA